MGRRKIPMEQREHGTRATYGKGCRCEPCKDANRFYGQQWRWNSRKAGYRFNKGRRVFKGERMYASEVPFDV